MHSDEETHHNHVRPCHSSNLFVRRTSTTGGCTGFASRGLVAAHSQSPVESTPAELRYKSIRDVSIRQYTATSTTTSRRVTSYLIKLQFVLVGEGKKKTECLSIKSFQLWVPEAGYFHVPQFRCCSSAPSMQSAIPSHIRYVGIVNPSEHLNISGSANDTQGRGGGGTS